ncbi:hypothetical protein TVAGG3_0788380, partial [Trichomonas vaginalis G3]
EFQTKTVSSQEGTIQLEKSYNNCMILGKLQTPNLQ